MMKCSAICFPVLMVKNVVVKLQTNFQDPIRWSPLTDVVDGYSPTLPHLKGLQNGDTATSAIKQVNFAITSL